MIRIFENGMKVLGAEKMFKQPKNFTCSVVTKKHDDGTIEKLPTLSEKGGAADIVGVDYVVGNSRIITDSRFSPKKPWFIVKNPKPCGDHAEFVVKAGDHVIEAFIDSGIQIVTIFEIVDVISHGQGFLADAVVLGTMEDDVWQPYAPKRAALAVEAAIQKAITTHCAEPFFVQEFRAPRQRPMQEVQA